MIGERVRDKIAASKRKGLWMGGLPPLGFDVEDRCLIVNAAEAEIVVDVFQRYLRLKSVRALEAELAVAGILSKRRIRADGSTYGGKALSRGALYLMLQNRLYRGEVAYKGAIYAGAHAAIVDEPQWTDVQTLLAINRVGHASGARASHPSLLGGFVFDRNGARLTPSHAVKAGVRYRYYVSRALVVGHARNCRDGWRIPAGDLERGVVGRLRALLTDPGALMDAIGDDEANATNLDEIIQRARKIARDLSDAEPQRIKEILQRSPAASRSAPAVLKSSYPAIGSSHCSPPVGNTKSPGGQTSFHSLSVLVTSDGREPSALPIPTSERRSHYSGRPSVERVTINAPDPELRLNRLRLLARLRRAVNEVVYLSRVAG